MVLIQLDLPENIDKELRRYMIDYDVLDKRIAIVEVLKKYFNKGGRK